MQFLQKKNSVNSNVACSFLAFITQIMLFCIITIAKQDINAVRGTYESRNKLNQWIVFSLKCNKFFVVQLRSEQKIISAFMVGYRPEFNSLIRTWRNGCDIEFLLNPHWNWDFSDWYFCGWYVLLEIYQDFHGMKPQCKESPKSQGIVAIICLFQIDKLILPRIFSLDF